jgi:hypothetical protein
MRSLTLLFLTVTAAAACGGSTNGGTGGSAGTATAGSGTGGAAGGVGGMGASGGSAGSPGGSAGAGGTGAVYDWQTCAVPGDCTLLATNCCGGYCSETPISGWIPVNIASVGVVQSQYCMDPVACPDCMNFPHENYIGVCRAQQCVAVDIRTDAISACDLDQDCRLRFGADCCESCYGHPTELVAVRADGQLEQEVCNPQFGACDPCVPPAYPTDAAAECVAGHCQVVWAAQPGG